MATLFSSTFTKVQKIGDKQYIMKINKNEENMIFYKSLQLEDIEHSIEDTDSGIEITLNVGSVQSLPQYVSKQKGFLSYQDCNTIFYDVGNQIMYLERNNYTLVDILPEDILVLDDKHYIYCGILNLFSLSDEDNSMVKVNSIVKSGPFSTPEITSLREIPVNIHKSAWMFSLGYMLSYFMTNDVKLMSEKSLETVRESLSAILDTKLYYALLRCCHDRPSERIFLYV